MANIENFRNQGWYLSEEGFENLRKLDPANDLRILTRRALDIDIREIGIPVISTELTKNMFGPVVLQVLKIRNISAPKSKPSSQGAPRMLKLSLTDGHSTCQSIEIKHISTLSVDHTPPGTKVFIDGAQIASGCVLLEPNCCKILGGNVVALVEKWQLSKIMPNHVRINEDGPPPWVNFGMRIINTVNSQGFKSLDKGKETKEDSEFQEQRKEAISEAIQGAVKKVFGGGVKQPQTFNSDINNTQGSFQREPRQPRKRREKLEIEKLDKPTQKVSLFNFLEDKLPQNELAQIRNAEMNNVVPQTKLENKMNDYGQKNKYAGNSSKQNYRDNSSKENSNYRENYRDNPKNKQNYNQYRQDDPKLNFDPSIYTDNSKFYNPSPKYPESNSRFNSDNRYSDTSSRYIQDNTRFDQDYAMFNSNNIKFNPTSYGQETMNYTDNRYSQDRYNVDVSPKFNIDKFNPEPNPRYSSENRYHNDKPPRFQKKNDLPNSSKFVHPPNESKAKPKNNHFVDKLTMEINNISLYNHKYENEKLKPKNVENSDLKWQWKSGDRCMAKYWEDNKFYNAVVTGVTNRTCMVEFLEYGNYEEVLHSDCIPITSDKQDQQMKYSDDQELSNSLEFRRGRNQPFAKISKAPGQPKYYNS